MKKFGPVLERCSLAIRERYRLQFVLAGTTIFAASLALVYYRYNFHTLSMEAMDIAQLGRNIAAGRGYTTYFMRPLALSMMGQGMHSPDLVNAPLYPLISGLAFAVLGARESVVCGLSLTIYIASCVLLFLLANRLSRNLLVASLTVCVLALSQPVLALASSGSPIILSSGLLLALLLALTHKATLPAVDEAVAADSQPTSRQLFKRYCFIGMLAALCYLADYSALLYVLPFILLWGRALRHWNRRTVAALALGFILVALPWWVRNFRLTGNPFYTLQWLELLMRTDSFPGLSLYREVDSTLAGTQALVSLNAKDFLEKMIHGVVAYFHEAPKVPHLYLMPFVLLAYWIRSDSREMEQLKWGTLTGVALYILGLCALGRTSQSYLLPLAGLLTCIGVATYQSLVSSWLERWKKHRAEANLALSVPTYSRLLLRIQLGFVFGLLGVLSFPLAPLAWAMLNRAGSPENGREKAIAQMAAVTPKKVIVCDMPWVIAWYGNRAALWIPNRVEELARLEKIRPVQAVYLSPMILSYRPDEKVEEWQQTYRQTREIAGYRKMVRPAARDIMYLKLPSLAEAKALVKAQPKSAAAHADLGRAIANAGQLRAALQSFTLALSLRSNSLEAQLGAAATYLQLKKYDRAEAHFEKALKLSPRSLPAQLGLAETLYRKGRSGSAIKIYEQVLADHPNYPLAINNLAYLYAAGNQDLGRALEMSRRAVAGDPTNASLWDTLGWVSYRSGRYAEAVKYLQQAVRLAPDRGLFLYHLGRSLLAAGHRQRAARSLQAALSRGLAPAERRDAEAALKLLQ